MQNQYNPTTQYPAVAGQFYPSDRVALAQEVDTLLRKAQQAIPDEVVSRPKALIVPHAGYIYSDAGAAAAYVRLSLHAEKIQRVVVFGPAHR